MENNQQTEIDLIDILAKVYRLILKRKWVILFCMCAAAYVGFEYIKKNEFKYSPSYEKQFVIFSHNISKESIKDIVESLNLRITSESFSEKSDQQQVSSVAHQKIYTVFNNVKEIKVDLDHYRETNNGSLKLSVIVSQKKYIDKAIDAILLYINSNNNLKKNVEEVKAGKTLLLSVINKKINELDSINKKNNKSSNPGIADLVKTNEIKNYIEAYDKKMELERDLEKLDANVFFKEDRFPVFYDNNKKKYIVVTGFVSVGFVLGVVFSGVLLLFSKFKKTV